ncbi:MAG: metallophosphoesterase [Candidatus Nanoarchaeia archaeon]
MNICKGIKIQDLALFFEKERTLILGDLHIGEEAAMKRDGVLIPRFQQKDLIDKTKKILSETKPDLIILNGDVKHEFGGISKEEWKQVLDYLDILQKSSKVVIIKGNHDKIIGPIANKKGIPVLEHYLVNQSTYVCHGDIIHTNDAYKQAKIIIIGHEHPAIGLRSGNRVEKYKCFLKGKYQNKTLIVMPSMNQLTEGTDVLSEILLSPFLNTAKLDSFETWIVENEVYPFGKLKGLRRE